MTLNDDRMVMKTIEGIIYKGIGGFYYVKTADAQLIECKPRGLFRKQGIKPVAGDKVHLLKEADTYYIDEVLPRKNVFIRPPVANVEQFFIIASTVQPVPSFLVIDKLSAVAFDNEAEPVLVITKTDLAAADSLKDAYATSGIKIVELNVEEEEGLEEVRQLLPNKLSVFCGNSGVGKSTLLNALLPHAERETGEISQKLGRGRHTTREVEIFEVNGGLVADTPGFASFDVQRASPIIKENLQFAFPEIAKKMNECRFTGCSHVTEAGCAVRGALEVGEISPSRYQSYVEMYKEAQQAEKY